MLSQKRIVTVPVSDSSLSRPNSELSFVLEMTNFLGGRLSLPEVLAGALEKLQEQFSMEAGRIYLMDPDHRGLTLGALHGLPPGGLERVDLGEGFSGRSAQERCFIAQRVEDLEDTERSAMLIALGLKSIICLPLIAGGQVVGVINLGSRRLIKLEMETIDLLSVLGNIIAVALENVRRAGRLEEQAREIKSQKEAVEFLAYTVSHDLKSPASAIGALADRLLRVHGKNLDPKGQETCRQVRKAAEGIERLVRELNHYIQAKAQPLKLEMVDLQEVAADIQANVSADLVAEKVTLAVPDDLGRVWADRLTLTRALTNLVDNALKYGGPDLSLIELSRGEQDDFVVLTVKDNGVGLSPELGKNVFELFRRGETSQGREGTGLGLAIVQQAAKRHGGEAWVDSQPGQGAAFHISLLKEG